MKTVTFVTVVTLLFTPAAVAAGDRQHIDFFSKDGQRKGYGVIDQKKGTIDTYDKNSNRTGSGWIGRDGSITIFSDGHKNSSGGRKGKK